ncbi:MULTISPECIES: hypothetical protein [Hydrocarboniphaga]|uniref:Uncharacterized protein n=1 Tax=Hydrocarboniphaga effusa AP103 TaxID=1172194 RepID=I8I2C9_9GAMM|nr:MULTISPECIES: hypothetical protein [Hydrocarboniphaga]EIT69986.1 hypothetical protein WQQ_01230 [Hydrocarboniphaga effusa AP103]EIT70173.1 hypothetical protein WQQ_03100 [Hydrocarboniphaga effusa AP103]MDZ4077197.1 hypothetical protein [Hydrocarboniphaga sp.]
MPNDSIALPLCKAPEHFLNFNPTEWTGGASFSLTQRLNENRCQLDARAYWADRGSVHNPTPHAFVAFDASIPTFGLSFRIPNLTPPQARQLAANLQMAANEADEFERLAAEVRNG